MKKIRIACALLIIALLFASALTQAESAPSVVEISKHGNLVLSVSGTELLNMGYAYGDIISVNIGGKTIDMPVCTNYTEVPVGSPVCRVKIDAQSGADNVALAINAGSIVQAYGIAEKILIEEDPGYRWEYADGIALPLPVGITMQEAGGYYDEWMLYALQRSNAREDYPHLTDAQFANFREITTSGMGSGKLYRSSSPINPDLGRSAYADAAAEEAGIAAIVNLAESISPELRPRGYFDSCNTISLNLSMDFDSPVFRAGLARGLRFILENNGPYLIHCNEGKDRAGFASAILECLMGAGVHEVLDDYMVSYYNYYGTEPGSVQHYAIAEGNLKKSLESAFEVDNLYAKGISLAEEAADYLHEQIGLSKAEIEELKNRLS